MIAPASGDLATIGETLRAARRWAQAAREALNTAGIYAAEAKRIAKRWNSPLMWHWYQQMEERDGAIWLIELTWKPSKMRRLLWEASACRLIYELEQFDKAEQARDTLRASRHLARACRFATNFLLQDRRIRTAKRAGKTPKENGLGKVDEDVVLTELAKLEKAKGPRSSAAILAERLPIGERRIRQIRAKEKRKLN